VNGKNKIFLETEVKKIKIITILKEIFSVSLTAFASALK